jgi:glycosyltransferase involved in cell wall biosynthesis
MLRNNDTPGYDMRMALQKKSLEDAGYDVYQIFIRYENGLNIWMLHKSETTHYHESEDDFVSKTMNICAKLKPLAPLRNIMTMHLMYKFITKYIKKIDAVHAHNLDTMPLAAKLKSKYKCKIVYDMREMYAHMAGRGFSSVVKNYYLNKEKRMMNKADWIFIMEELTRKWVKNMNKKVPISLVMNSRPLIYKECKNWNKQAEPLTMLFLGTISQPRFISEAIDVVEKMNGRVKFYIGGCPQSDPYYHNTIAKCKKVKHSEFIGVVPYTSVVPLTRQCDVVFCMLNPEQYNNGRAVANKQLEAMVAGRPIITSAGSYAGQITNENDCGMVIKHDKIGLQIGLQMYLNFPELRIVHGKNALKAAKEKYNWSIDSKRMLSAYSELLYSGMNTK